MAWKISAVAGTTPRVLVLGGSGFIGNHVCERLQRLGWRVTVPARWQVAGKHLLSLPTLRLVVADPLEPGTLARLLPGHDAVVNLIGIRHGSEPAFERAHVELPRQIVAACAQAGVRRVVHVSALGAQADAPSMYQRSKARGEAVLQQAAAAGALDLTVLRPSVVFGAGDRLLNLFASLQKWLPFVPLASADTRFQPVWVRDVAHAVAAALQRPTSVGQTYDACGPEVWTLRELVRAAGQWSGVRGGRGRPILGLSRALGRLQALVLELMPGQPLMSRDNLDSMRVDNVAGGQWPGLDALDIRAAPLSAVGPMVLGQAGPQARLDRFRRSAGR